MADKKIYTKRMREDSGGNPYYYEQQYTPSALIGKALGLHPKPAKINREAKGDKPKGQHPPGVGLADIRKKYRRKEDD